MPFALATLVEVLDVGLVLARTGIDHLGIELEPEVVGEAFDPRLVTDQHRFGDPTVGELKLL